MVQGKVREGCRLRNNSQAKLHHFYVTLLSVNAAPNKSVALSQPLTLNIKCTQISQGHENLEEQKAIAF